MIPAGRIKGLLVDACRMRSGRGGESRACVCVQEKDDEVESQVEHELTMS